MSDNGSGVAQINSTGQPVVGGTDITDTVHNALTSDLATMLSNRICKDGQTTITQNIPFNTKKITGLGEGTARTDAASLATIQDGTGVYVGTVGGTADVITLTPSPAITSYVAGQVFRFLTSGDNTAAVTVAISGLSAMAVTKNGTTALVAGDLLSGAMAEIVFDGTRFMLTSVSTHSTGTWTPSSGGSATYNFQIGTYTRIGNVVFFRGFLDINTLGTGSATAISGLPFTCAAAFPVSAGQTANLAVSPVSLSPEIGASTQSISLYGRTAGAAATTLLSALGNGSTIVVGGSYLI